MAEQLATLNVVDTYLELMRELKNRIAAWNYAVEGGTGLSQPFVEEFCGLQARMICELTAIAVLVAHGSVDGAQTGPLREADAPGKIFNRLREVNARYFPEAVVATSTAVGQVLSHPSGEFITERELREVHGRSA